MFDRRLLLTGIAVLATAAVSLLIINITSPDGVVPSQEIISNVEKQAQASQSGAAPADNGGDKEYAYILKAYNGRVAVFIPGRDEPEMVFEAMVKFLPDYDRVLMEEGIPVRDFEALTAIIEDYIS